MASSYVGTPSYKGSDLYTIASVIQGEAAGEGRVGMTAVANVMQNRAATNFSGYGSSVIDQVLARNQFQGQRVPGPAALSVAQDLVGGRLSDVTGGALYYANPTASTARWAVGLNEGNALKINNHYFTDNAKGIPFKPQAGVGGFTAQGAGTSQGATPNPSGGPATSTGAVSGGGTGAQPGGSTGPGIITGMWEATGSTAVSTGAKTVSEGTQKAADTASKSLTENTAKATESLTSNVDKSISTGTGWLQSTFDNLKDLFVRSGIGIFGLVMIAGAVFYFTKSANPARG